MVPRVSYFITETPRKCSVSNYLALFFYKNSDNKLFIIRWDIHPDDPLWTYTTVIDALTGLSRLREFYLTIHRTCFHDPSFLQFDRLSNLQKISITGSTYETYRSVISRIAEAIAKSPQLVHLEVKTMAPDFTEDTPSLHDLLSKVAQDRPLQLTRLILHGMCAHIDSFTVPHLRSLVSLDLKYLYTPTPRYVPDQTDQRWEQASTLTDIYATLNREEIHLKEVRLADVDNVILDYLCSYSGLEMLAFNSIFLNSLTRKQSDALSRRFYNSVLPNHVNSLRVLRIHPSFGGGWCYNPEDVSQATALSQCTKLRSLSVAINSQVTFAKPDDASEHTLDSCTSSLHRPSPPPPPSSDMHHQFDVNLNDAVCLMLV
jgi:hypothetical protein